MLGSSLILGATTGLYVYPTKLYSEKKTEGKTTRMTLRSKGGKLCRNKEIGGGALETLSA